jgi:hypothetical protein
MHTRHIFNCTTLAAALLSAFVLAQPAHAGLLGGGIGGGGGAGATGAFANRNFDVGGSAAANASREARLPRADQKAAEARSRTSQMAGSAGNNASAMAGASRSKAETIAARSTSADVSKSASVTAQPGSADAAAMGAGQLSRGDRSVNAGGATQGSLRH